MKIWNVFYSILTLFYVTIAESWEEKWGLNSCQTSAKTVNTSIESQIRCDSIILKNGIHIYINVKEEEEEEREGGKKWKEAETIQTEVNRSREIMYFSKKNSLSNWKLLKCFD